MSGICAGCFSFAAFSGKSWGDWAGRRILFSDCGTVSSGRSTFPASPVRRFVERGLRNGYFHVGYDGRRLCETCKAPLPSLFNASLVVDDMFLKKCAAACQRSLEGSYTVEASFVMACALFAIAVLLTGIFQIHGRVVGNFVLQEGLERLLCLEEDPIAGNKSGEQVREALREEELKEEELARLRSYFRCGRAELTMEKKGSRLTGKVNTGFERELETEISVKEFEPETFLRLLRAIREEE